MHAITSPLLGEIYSLLEIRISLNANCISLVYFMLNVSNFSQKIGRRGYHCQRRVLLGFSLLIFGSDFSPKLQNDHLLQFCSDEYASIRQDFKALRHGFYILRRFLWFSWPHEYFAKDDLVDIVHIVDF